MGDDVACRLVDLKHIDGPEDGEAAVDASDQRIAPVIDKAGAAFEVPMFAHLRHDGEPLPDGWLKTGEETAEARFAVSIGRSRIVVMPRSRALASGPSASSSSGGAVWVTPHARPIEQAKAEFEAVSDECLQHAVYPPGFG